MKISDFKIGGIYYAEIKNPNFKYTGPDLILNVFRVNKTHRAYPDKFNTDPAGNGHLFRCFPTLECTPFVSNWNTQWYHIRPQEILKAHEVKLEDLPLYINFPEQSPAFHELLKGNHV